MFTGHFCSAKMKGETMQEHVRKTHLARRIEKTADEIQYDENVKKILSDKQVLARIVKHRTEEFKDYDISTIMECIEGTPEISTVSVYPGTEKQPDHEVITGMNTESKEPKEGMITFDVRFYMLTKDQKQIKIILNIEAQKDYYPGYHFEPRAIFYCARMISEQLDREFTTKNYDKLKKVYSIWIFFNAPQKDSDTITEYHLTKKDVYGRAVAGGNYDYLSISFIRLNVGKDKKSKDQLIRMLDTIFSDKMDAEQKKRILETEHQMIMTRELEGEIGSMCNVSEGLWERAMNEGMLKGISQGISEGISQGEEKNRAEVIKNMLSLGLPLEIIAKSVGISEEEVKKISGK